MSEGSQLSRRLVYSFQSFAISLITWLSQNPLFIETQGGGVQTLYSDRKIWVHECDFFI